MATQVLERTVARTVRDAIRPLTGATEDYDPLLELIGEARFVLIGEASHGTHEFYRARAEITQRLIQEQGFTAVAVEADWPDAYRVNCYVRGKSGTWKPVWAASISRRAMRQRRSARRFGRLPDRRSP